MFRFNSSFRCGCDRCNHWLVRLYADTVEELPFHISMPWIALRQSYPFIRSQIEPYPKPQSLQDELRSGCRGRSRSSRFTNKRVDMFVILQMHVSTIAAVIGGIRAEGHLSPEDRGDSTQTDKSVPSPEVRGEWKHVQSGSAERRDGSSSKHCDGCSTVKPKLEVRSVPMDHIMCRKWGRQSVAVSTGQSRQCSSSVSHHPQFSSLQRLRGQNLRKERCGGRLVGGSAWFTSTLTMRSTWHPLDTDLARNLLRSRS